MSQIEFKSISKYFGESEIIPNLNLEIKDGEFMVFVGPSGCGKSTILRLLAGLERASGGDIIIDGEVVTQISPANRGVAMVFQNYALYPHMTVFENMAFGVQNSGKSKAETQELVNEVAKTLHIEKLLTYYPKQLSGGQRQRVAIGRAIVRRPKVFLFDEPLSNLDASLRVKMRIELAKLHSKLATTMIYVTHDQTEAMTLGNRICVFNQGRIEQVGTPLELYQRPNNIFVAEFLGSPKMNILSYTWQAQSKQVQLDEQVNFPHQLVSDDTEALSKGEYIAIRPEHLSITEKGKGIAVIVDFIETLGDVCIVYAKVKDSEQMLVAKLQVQQIDLKAQDCVDFLPDEKYTLVFDSNQQRIE